MTSRDYTIVVLALCAATAIPVVGLNVYLGEHALGTIEVTRLASNWQQATQGITYAPPISFNRPFKALRLVDRLGDINGIVFGASTALGLSSSDFPENIRIYNFSQTFNSVASSLGEAEYVSMRSSARIKWFFLAIDWSIGFLFEKRSREIVNLAPETILRALAVRDIPLHYRLQDAMSYPKVAILGTAIGDVLRAKDKSAAFRQRFLASSSDEYICSDGVRAKDFDVLFRGKCEGFYYDGSSDFPTRNRLSLREAAAHLIVDSNPRSIYASALQLTGGLPNSVFLAQIAQIKKNVAPAGGKVIVLLPPLLPGLEQRLSVAPQTAAHLAKLKQTLEKWALQEGIVVIDAGRAERFGCESGEFLDAHHATRECYKKLLKRFWADYRRGIAPGIYDFN